ncbi:MAG: MBL fold metallo-hydrolase, partial [Candidatus Zixiibacteriota bacterium]
SCSSWGLEASEKSSYLFDCGEGISSSILRFDVDYNRINAIFITHTHSDHISGLFLLLQMMYLSGRENPLKLYLPEEAIPGVKNFLNLIYLFPEKLSFDLYFHSMNPGLFFEDSDLKVFGYPNKHLIDNKELIEKKGISNKMESFCLEIKFDDKRIVYSGDVGVLEDLEMISRDADFLLTECMHINLDELIKLIIKNKVKKVIFTHIPPEMEKEKDEIVRKAKELGFSNPKFAFDGMIIEF